MSTETAPPVAAPATAAASTTSATSAPWYSDWVRTDGKINTAAYDRLPDDIRTLKNAEGGDLMKTSLSRHGDVDGFMRHVASLEGLVGKKAGLQPIAADAPETARAEWKKQLDGLVGVPPTAKDYGFKKPEGIPDANWDQAAMDRASEVFHKHSLSAAAAKELVGFQSEVVKSALAKQEQDNNNWYKAQDEKVRSAVAQINMPYDKATDLVTRTATTLGLSPTSPNLKSAEVFLAILKAGQMVSEDKLVKGTSADSTGAGADRATAESIMHDKSNPLYAIYWSKDGHPQHQQVVDRVNTLLAATTPKRR